MREKDINALVNVFVYSYIMTIAVIIGMLSELVINTFHDTLTYGVFTVMLICLQTTYYPTFQEHISEYKD